MFDPWIAIDEVLVNANTCCLVLWYFIYSMHSYKSGPLATLGMRFVLVLKSVAFPPKSEFLPWFLNKNSVHVVNKETGIYIVSSTSLFQPGFSQPWQVVIMDLKGLSLWPDPRAIAVFKDFLMVSQYFSRTKPWDSRNALFQAFFSQRIYTHTKIREAAKKTFFLMVLEAGKSGMYMMRLGRKDDSCPMDQWYVGNFDFRMVFACSCLTGVFDLP